MFDSTAIIEISARGSAGIQAITIRWPSDEEWATRVRGRKIIVRRLGRGQSETSSESGEVDLALYNKITTNGAPPLSAAEATRIIDAIATCEATDVIVDGTQATVELHVVSGPVKHQLTIPTAEQVLSFRRSAVRLIDLPFNKQEVRVNPDAGAKLWEACQGKSDDYTGGVIPSLHKDAAVRAVIEFLDRELAPKTNENF